MAGISQGSSAVHSWAEQPRSNGCSVGEGDAGQRREIQYHGAIEKMLVGLLIGAGRPWQKAVHDLEMVEAVSTMVFCIVGKGDRDIKIREKGVLLELQQVAGDKKL